ncbi:MAG: sterol desaturase family protein [Bacteroidetes bacterium]|nr:sterol desaturase family protein [Bacteroidota bacterium]
MQLTRDKKLLILVTILVVAADIAAGSLVKGSDELREKILILFTVPLYIVVIGAEILFSFFKEKKYYSSEGIISNIYLTAMNMGFDLALRVFSLWILTQCYSFGDFQLNILWGPVIYWVTLTIFEDFMYYWEHRVDHFCRFFWASHVTHHSSEEYNFTVGFRSSVFQPFYRFLYFIPIALLGFRPEDILFTYAFTQMWGIFVHTQTIGKMWKPIEMIMCTPSHHRVHHASNVKYLDKNMGMLLIIWDKMFGTFQEEDKNYEPIKYGLTSNIGTYNPITMVFHEWRNIAKDLKKPVSFKDKLMYVFGPPGWSHDGSTQTSSELRSLEEKKKEK